MAEVGDAVLALVGKHAQTLDLVNEPAQRVVLVEARRSTVRLVALAVQLELRWAGA